MALSLNERRCERASGLTWETKSHTAADSHVLYVSLARIFAPGIEELHMSGTYLFRNVGRVGPRDTKRLSGLFVHALEVSSCQSLQQVKQLFLYMIGVSDSRLSGSIHPLTSLPRDYDIVSHSAGRYRHISVVGQNSLDYEVDRHDNVVQR